MLHDNYGLAKDMEDISRTNAIFYSIRRIKIFLLSFMHIREYFLAGLMIDYCGCLRSLSIGAFKMRKYAFSELILSIL
jgi:hypothetical protein